MQCPVCGRQNRPGARFCDRCRAPLSQGDQAGSALPATVQPGMPSAGPGGQGWEPSDAPIPSSSSMLSGRTGQQMAVSRAASHEGFQGVAHAIQQRMESYGRRTRTILTFRLEQFDQISGDRTRVIPVEMSGLSIVGFINEGDQVTVFGRVKEGLLRAKRVDNSTAGGRVEAAGAPADAKIVRVLGLLAVTSFLVIWLVLVSLFLLH